MATTDDSTKVEYYTPEMMTAVASIENIHGFKLDISQMQDDDGPYLVIIIDHDEYTQFGKEYGTAIDVARYIVDVHTALRQCGARVTYAVIDDYRSTT